MNKNEKKYKRSGVAVACYVIAAALLAYVCYQIGNTVSTINEYYAQYDMSATATEYITYCGQAALEPFFYALVTFMLGYILDAVRKNNKANYFTDEELDDARAAKKEAREAKKFAKGEAAAAKAGNVTTDEKSVEADFVKSLDAELKADAKKPAEKKQGSGQRKSGGNRKNSSYNNRTNNSGNNGGANKSGGARKSSGKKPAAEKAENKTEFKADIKPEVRTEAKKAGEAVRAEAKQVKTEAKQAKEEVKAEAKQVKTEVKQAKEEVKAEAKSE